MSNPYSNNKWTDDPWVTNPWEEEDDSPENITDEE